jgi:GNAT superfamily N-acetyltransferase
MKTFSQFLEEAKAAKPDALKTITKNWERRHRGLNVYASQSNGNIRVHDLWVHPNDRRSGIGGRIMKGLTNFADRQKSKMSLNQSPEKGFKNKLNAFYSRHGFVPNKGKNKDFSTTDTHIRYPVTREK